MNVRTLSKKHSIAPVIFLMAISVLLTGCGAPAPKPLPPQPTLGTTNLVSKSAVRISQSPMQEIHEATPDRVVYDANGRPQIVPGDCINSDPGQCYGKAQIISNPGQTITTETAKNIITSTEPVTWYLYEHGYDPYVLHVEKGTTVTVLNKTGSPRWPYSSTWAKFDSGRPIQTNGTYSFVFELSGVYVIKDRLSDLVATIYVQE